MPAEGIQVRLSTCQYQHKNLQQTDRIDTVLTCCLSHQQIQGALGTRPPLPPRNHAFFRHFYLIPPILSKFWVQAPLGSKLHWAPPLIKILDLPLISLRVKRQRQNQTFCWKMTFNSNALPQRAAPIEKSCSFAH